MENENIELIRNNPKKAVLKLSFPIFIMLIISMVYNLIDTVWVSGLGPNALSAMAFVSPIYMLLVSIGAGIGTAASSLISISIGANDHKHANNVGLHAILLGGILSIIPAILILFFMKPILIFIGAGKVLNYAMDYSYIIFVFIFVFIYSSIGSSFFRGVKKDNYLELTYKDFKLNLNIIKEIIGLAIPATLETTVVSVLTLLTNLMIKQASNSVSVGVYTASMQVVQFTIIPLTAISVTLLTVAGVAYGANNFKNLKTAHSFCIRIGFVLAIVSAIIMIIFSSPIATIFSYSNKSAELTPLIASTISILSLYVIAIPHGLMSSALFKAIGKGLYSLILTIIRSLLLEIVCAYLFCFTFGWGLNGIYAGIIIGCFLGSVVGYIWAKIFIINKLEKKHIKSIHEIIKHE